MKNFMKDLCSFMVNKKRVNYRDRRGHYASANLSCLRDQYWALTGEPETNPADFVGRMKMMAGDAIEAAVNSALL